MAFFEAKRENAPIVPDSIRNIDISTINQTDTKNIHKQFISYMVRLRNTLLNEEYDGDKQKAKSIKGWFDNFENTLKTELGRCKHESLDSKMKDVDLSRLNPSVYVDSSNYSYRLDGSNVDIDTEEVELASEQIRYQGITAGINGQFDRMRSVIK